MNVSLNPTGNSLGGESEARTGLIPELVHPRDENKGIMSPNEQGHMDPSRELKGLLRSSDNTTLAMSTPHHSQSIIAYNVGSTHSGDLAKRIQLRGPLNQPNSSSSNLQQGNTPNGPASSSIALDTLPGNSRSSTSPGAPIGFGRTASRADNPSRRQPTQPSHTGIDPSRLQPFTENHTTSSSDISTRNHRADPFIDATSRSREASERPSGPSVGSIPPTSPTPAFLSPGNNDPRAYSNSNLSISGSAMAARSGAPAVQPRYHPSEAPQSQRIVSQQPSRQPNPQPNPNPQVPRGDALPRRKKGLAAICGCSQQ